MAFSWLLICPFEDCDFHPRVCHTDLVQYSKRGKPHLSSLAVHAPFAKLLQITDIAVYTHSHVDEEVSQISHVGVISSTIKFDVARFEYFLVGNPVEILCLCRFDDMRLQSIQG